MAFDRYVFLPVLPGLAALLLAFLLYWGIRMLETRRMQKASSQALNLYLDPALAGQIGINPDIMERRGESREVTVLFTDLAGFTAMAEAISCQETVEMLNRYYETMTAAIERYDGFVDKFVGDSIMAVWGAPLDQPRHASAACLSALTLKKLLDFQNRELAAAGKPHLETLMGLNTGPVIAGNIGASRRVSYTVLGDSVNLANRLVSVNKLFGTSILASEATAELARGDILFRALDRVRVVGRKGSIKVFEAIAPMGERDPALAQAVNYFERALKHYWARDFAGALARFEAALKAKPNDRPSLVFTGRCREYIESPPDESWDGVTVLALK
jgi:adenylate cyclase